MSRSRLRFLAQGLVVRLRFPLLLAGVLALIAAWPWLRARWDRLTRPGSGIDTAVSPDTEYWCPMCPGVVSDWPAKCPVCHMALVRRKKGEATPLPDGVVARMQLSPYRVQLAGIRTTAAEFLPLAWEATFAGLVEPGESAGRVLVPIDVSEMDVANLRPGVMAEVASEAFPGQAFPARVRDLGRQVAADTRTLRVRLDVDDPGGRLRAGAYVTARLRVPLTEVDGAAERARDDWRDRTAVELAVRSLPAFAVPAPGLESLLAACGRQVLYRRGLTLAVPAGAVIDTGERKVVFVERMPGMFDGVEVTLGRRSGDHYPVLRGLEPGERVVTAGAFLLDAETRLNPSLAASYFGAGSRPGRTGGSPAAGGPEKLSAEDRQLAARQKVCPVTGEPLDSMGGPVRVLIEGRPVFICCKGCEAELRARPKEYLDKIRPK
jgi:hypothetical protein